MENHDIKIDELQKVLNYGKCIINENCKEMVTLKDLFNIPLHHSPECGFEFIYKNKSEEEIKKIEEKYSELAQTKNKKIKFASCGVIMDNTVNN